MRILLCVLISLLAAPARASMATCRTAAQAQPAECKGAAATVGAASNAASGAVGSACQGVAGATCSFDLSGVAAKSAAAYQKAIGFCEQQIQLCEKNCVPSPSERNADAILAEKEKCISAIKATIAQLGASSVDAGGAAPKAFSSGDAASVAGGLGQALQGMAGGGQGKGGDSGGSDASKYFNDQSKFNTSGSDYGKSKDADSTGKTGSSANMGFQANCSSEQGYMMESCVSQLTQECNLDVNVDQARCKSFRSRYCSKDGMASGDNNAIKPGAGMGSGFCVAQVARDFCAKPGTGDCASCRKLQGLPPKEGRLPDVCGIDPQSISSGGLATASVGSNSNAPGRAGGAGGGGTGGGGGGGAGMAGGAAAQNGETRATDRETAGGSDYKSQNGGADGGGGGGGYAYGGHDDNGSGSGSGSGLDDLFKDLDGKDKKGKDGLGDMDRGLATTADGLSLAIKDVEGRKGPGVFALSSAVVQSRCRESRLLHCGPGK